MAVSEPLTLPAQLRSMSAPVRHFPLTLVHALSSGMATRSTSAQATSQTVSLTVTSKGQVTLRKELLAHLGVEPGQRIDVEALPGGRLQLHAEQATGSIDGFIGLLAGRSSHRASLEELSEAASSGWSGL